MSGGHFGIDPRLTPYQTYLSNTIKHRGATILTPMRASKNKVKSFGENPYVLPVTSKTTPIRPLSTTSPVQNHRSSPSISDIYDSMCIATLDVPLHVAIEAAATKILKAKLSILWISLPDQHQLYSPSLSHTTNDQRSIVSHCYQQNEVIYVERPPMDVHFDMTVDISESAALYTPLSDRSGNVLCVIQSITSTSKPLFSEDDLNSMRKFSQKFVYYAHLLFNTELIMESTADMSVSGEMKNVIDTLITQLEGFFKCRKTEFFSMDNFDKTFQQYVPEKGGFMQMREEAGASTFAMRQNAVINVEDVTTCPSYCCNVDGNLCESLLAIPMKTKDQTFAIVLRGKEKGRSFSATDAAYLQAIAPVISKSIQRANGAVSEDSQSRNEENQNDMAERLKALLEIAEVMSGIMDIDVLVPTIMERACALLNTERCSLFLVDTQKQELVTRFHGGLDSSIRLPLNRGIVGATATRGVITNIEDAYNDPRFDKTVDLQTGFKTRNILCVPIYNNRGEIAGVTEMINKIETGSFDEEDIKLMMAFNVFCGISLDNTKLYQSSLDLTRQLRSFVELSSNLNTTKTLSDVLEGIMRNAMDVIHSKRSTIYLYDIENRELKSFVKLGDGDDAGLEFAFQTVDQRKAKVYDKFEVATMLNLTKLDQEPADHSNKNSHGNLSRVSSVLSVGESPFDSQQSGNGNDEWFNILEFPLMTSDQRMLGVMELTCNWKILPEDIKLLDCFAVFASVSLEKSELHDIATLGILEANMKKWIEDDEKKSFDVPEKLKLTDKQKEEVFSNNFDAPLYDGYGHFKVLWGIFDEYDLFKTFKISNEKFFHFITEISETYKKVPYHNWRHAVDVTQFMTYEAKITELDKILTKFELFGMTVAAICHDANHDGFTNVYNEKAETPLGILFKNQSVMETHHCSVAIGIISKEVCNIFSELQSDEYKKMWTMIIHLILSTDMAKHHQFLSSTNERLDQGPLDFKEENDRIIAINLILKCADISNVSRPFEMADKWCDVLCEEFFRQGDLEMTNGMEYTSPLNDREHLDKPKSQIGFYTFVCLPLYQCAARGLPALQANVDQVQSNLAVWKKAIEANG